VNAIFTGKPAEAQAALEAEARGSRLTIGDWSRATERALALVRSAWTERLRALGARSFNDASHQARHDEGCRKLESVRRYLSDDADCLSYLPLSRPLADHFHPEES
jgi:hypothetical protein